MPVFLAVFIKIARQPHIIQAIFFHLRHLPLPEPLQRFQPMSALADPQGRLSNAVQSHAMSEKFHRIRKNIGERDGRKHCCVHICFQHRNIKMNDVEADDVAGIFEHVGKLRQFMLFKRKKGVFHV